VVARARSNRDRHLALRLEAEVAPLRFERGRIELGLQEGASPAIAQEVAARLKEWTGEPWVVAISDRAAPAETLRARRERAEAALMEEVRADPLVRRVLESFPDAEIVAVRDHDEDS